MDGRIWKLNEWKNKYKIEWTDKLKIKETNMFRQMYIFIYEKLNKLIIHKTMQSKNINKWLSDDL